MVTKDLRSHMADRRAQTSFRAQATFRDGTIKIAKLLVDTGCQAAILVNKSFVPPGLEYSSKQPLALVTADPNVAMPGGESQVAISLKVQGTDFESDARPLILDTAPHITELDEWDIMIGHPFIANRCLAQAPRFSMLRLHHPYPSLWIKGWEKTR